MRAQCVVLPRSTILDLQKIVSVLLRRAKGDNEAEQVLGAIAANLADASSCGSSTLTVPWAAADAHISDAAARLELWVDRKGSLIQMKVNRLSESEDHVILAARAAAALGLSDARKISAFDAAKPVAAAEEGGAHV